MITKIREQLASRWLVSSCLCLSLAAISPAFADSGIPMTEEVIDNHTYQVSRTVVRVRPEQVWQILTDFSQAPQIFHNLKRCEVLSDKGSTKLVHHEIRPSGLMRSFQYDLELKEHGHRMLQWHRVAGDFKDVDGFWKLEPVDGGRATQVTYASHVNGGFFLPQGLIKRQCRIDMPMVMASLKAHAEQTTHIASRRQETQRQTP